MGTVFRVLTQDARLADRVDRLLGDFEATESPARAAHIIHLSGAPEESHALYQGCARLESQDAGEDLLPTLVGVVNYAVIDRCPYFSAHAAVGAGGKRVVALPADSGQGKSTLAAAAYLGDLYLRVGRREDALKVWQRGAALFPTDRRLMRRLEREAANR